MNTFSRLAWFGLFAATGVSIAVCVGALAEPREDSNVATQPRPVRLQAATNAVEPEKIKKIDVPVNLPSPGPTLTIPSPMYARQAVSTSAPAPSSAAPPAKPPKSPATVQNDGDGKLRIHIYNEDIREVLGLLGEQGNLNILVSRNVEGKVSATLSGVDTAGALDAILKSTGYASRREGKFLFVGTAREFEIADQTQDPIAVRTYRTNYVRAAELIALVKPLLSPQGAASVSTPADIGIAADDSGVGGDRFAGNEVFVVRDRESAIAEIDKVVAKVDVPPMQVAIDAMILSVKLAETDPCGVNFDRLCRCTAVCAGTDSATEPSAVAGLKIGFFDTHPYVLLDALRCEGNVSVVANPRLMVLNKQRAEIQIGRRQGYVGRSAAESAGQQNVAFLDTGVQLRLRPFISSDGLIRMEVHPELSDGSVDLKGGFVLPNKDITQATTNIMAPDGRTVLIGGLIRKQPVTVTTQVSSLGGLPLVGGLFRRTSEQMERYEVLVLITPHIVREPSGGVR